MVLGDVLEGDCQKGQLEFLVQQYFKTNDIGNEEDRKMKRAGEEVE